ncbi:BON domain-containing protein [Allorhodopirellula solitaria]|uniref:BON domain protein n=1 Tax=Allorhodopirellula solitaria TaxID=2527987 RepID=A0A5C5XT15_9BACT|nr:BON domain-containing protein [Allorhodopirellula solitaria]TWT66396.1 hypothetical protein CA85_24900 [Allorhodopirellula solitaria]
MPISKSNAWYKWVPASMLVLSLIVCSSAHAQQAQDQGQGQGQQAGETSLNPDEAFASGVQRSGAVGSRTATVGASETSEAAGAAGGATGRAGGGFGGGFGGGGFGAALNNMFNNTNASSSSTPPIRTRLRSAVTLPPRSMQSQVSQEIAVNSRLHRASTLGPQPNIPSYNGGVGEAVTSRPFYGVNVQMQGRTAIMQGTVDDPADRRMSELLMRLEPGVSQVQNRISVAP